MSSLESAVETRLRLVVAEQTLIDWTNQRDDDAAENTAITTAAVEMACSEVKSILGDSVDSADVSAVQFGTSLSVLRLSNWWNIAFTAGVAEPLRQIRRDMEREADARRQGKHGQLRTPSTSNLDDLDAAYPSTPPWFDGTSSATGLPSDEDT